MGSLGWLEMLGPAENVWLTALGIALVAPFAAMVLPRLSRALGMVLVPTAMGLSFVATYHVQTTMALALITLAITAGFLISWSTRTVREDIAFTAGGARRRMPQHSVKGVTLTRAQSRSFDYLAMRSR